MVKNPCKKCLVRACCNTGCNDYNDFKNLCTKILPMICFGIAIISVFIIILLISLFITNTLLSILSIILLWIIGFIISNYYLTLNDIYVIDIGIIIPTFIYGPVLAITFLTVSLYRRYMNCEVNERIGTEII